MIRILCTLLFFQSLLALAQESGTTSYPEMKKELVGHIKTGADNPRNSEGAFVTLANGDIIHVYSHFYGNSFGDHATAFLASRRSSDGGRTWSETDCKELENEGKLNVMSVSLLRLQSGAIAMFYAVKESPGDCRLYMRVSSDEAKTWGERVLCIPDVSYNVVNNDRVIQLTEGRLLAPVARHAWDGKTDYGYNWNADIFCMISDDDGKTWRRAGDAAHVPGIIYQEPGLVELADGRILMNMRTNGGSQYMAWSDDKGETWTTPVPSELDSPVSPARIKRVPGSDHLIAVWNPKIADEGRIGMDIAILSPDGTKTLVRKEIERNPQGLQYPSIHFLDDKNFLVAYFSWPTGIFIYRMNLDDLKTP
ncbi:MAG: sialidase family protein [Planctomycetia bacterium]|nr:sialidase family protein [Planctomycetia bacterium]